MFDFSANQLLDFETELQKGFSKAISKIVGWIPNDLNAVLLTNLSKATQQVDNVGLVIEKLEENLKEFTDSLKMDSMFYKYISLSTTTVLPKNLILLA